MDQTITQQNNAAAQKKNGGAFAQLVKSNPSAFAVVKSGDLIEGQVLEKSSKMILVDLGRFGTGIIYSGELQSDKAAVRRLKSGDSIHGKVVDIDNEDGYIELSLTEAGKQKQWAAVTEMKDREELLTVKPISANRGGLIAELNGLQAFLPVSQLSNEHYPRLASQDADKNLIAEALQKLVGTELKVKIIDVSLRTNKLIISEREAVEVSSKELAKNYSVGDEIEGIVSGVADFGVFIRFADNPGLEGLIHVSELDHKIIDNPKEVLNVDDAVKVKIIDIKDGKIALSLKAMKPNPWESVTERYSEGNVVSGTVYSMNPFGAIVTIDNDFQGYVHVSEFGSVEEMKKKLTLKEQYSFVISAVKPQERRIILKLK